ncbi:hypothetical protein DFA_01876 [Cavenderia fasciculata]|uniref:Uncharacterized protein n=1 Tax=Cavenderia fasciculata TaxID=261658 RepID=F4PV82_CACFS|nr:uncharacterized protein DFA_01876 [Cavenderia fasciculata]EGG21990.1 hypothetical protein DFA_01876 [Cavenderia fasciculata]|eukprot:XP_004359841.1 hypothetical protein DFA_01876 [Cavenderia fasciculata]
MCTWLHSDDAVCDIVAVERKEEKKNGDVCSSRDAQYSQVTEEISIHQTTTTKLCIQMLKDSRSNGFID